LRLLKKIITDNEIEQVRNSPNPDAALWSFWACKEAAYKVVQKRTGGTAFVPRRWSVIYQSVPNAPADHSARTDDCREGEVVIPGADPVYFRLFTFPSYVHCLAAASADDVGAIVARVDRIDKRQRHIEENLSTAVRLRLIRLLARDLDLSEKDLQILREKKKGELGPPRLFVTGTASAVDLSISHDGRYGAYAYSV